MMMRANSQKLRGYLCLHLNVKSCHIVHLIRRRSHEAAVGACLYACMSAPLFAQCPYFEVCHTRILCPCVRSTSMVDLRRAEVHSRGLGERRADTSGVSAPNDILSPNNLFSPAPCIANRQPSLSCVTESCRILQDFCISGHPCLVPGTTWSGRDVPCG
ncbi:hypothetical protein BDV35DRAFT_131894 [Aspergillus flavus]|uniref:Uncharacterized protein n=1 Tax=Aspergillus flavus TaxID=5059 RepID=A0A5N6H8X0_ASPFL|nr:hypothetical protein BDV35DRAFT_131894 [Aspergillus flavus]